MADYFFSSFTAVPSPVSEEHGGWDSVKEDVYRGTRGTVKGKANPS